MTENSFFYPKNIFSKISLNNQHFHARESSANFGICMGNQKHPKLSTWTYDCSHVFYHGASSKISLVKMG